MLARCEETNLVLNWEKCHFMVKILAADHLSRLKNPDLGAFPEEEIVNKFPDKNLMILKAKLNDDEPCYADYVNYIVGKIVPLKWTPKKEEGDELLEAKSLKSWHTAILDQLGDITVPQLLEESLQIRILLA
ncbi:hypothetical protein Tco_0329482 [Tanacetum coccineum]